MNQVDQLKENLAGYISKYYQGKILRGTILTLIALLSAWLFIALLEYAGNFDERMRTMLFFAYLSIAVSLFTFQVVIPLLRWRGILHGRNNFEAASDIGRALTQVDDKLLNTLHLQQMVESSNDPLLRASLGQKATDLNTFTFSSAISFNSAWRLLRYFVLPVLVFSGLSLWNPAIIIDSSKRVLAFNESFVPPAPFSFFLLSETGRIPEGESIKIRVRTEGSEIPSQAFIQLGSSQIRMKKAEVGVFEHSIDRVSSDVFFRFNAAGVESEEFHFEVMPSPRLVRNSASISYPAYTGIQSEALINRSQLKLPEGTKVILNFETKNTDALSVESRTKMSELQIASGSSQFEFSVFEDDDLSVVSRNNNGLVDTSTLNIYSIADNVPSIRVSEMLDSTLKNAHYFNGEIVDDYGFSKLVFKLQSKTKSGRSELMNESLKLIKGANEQSFSFFFSLDSFNLAASDELEYYFEVWDNDAVNGSKSSQSQVWKLEVPSPSEIASQSDKQAEKSKSAMESQLSELDKINRELDDIKKNLLQKKKPDWQDKEQMKSLMEKQQEVTKKLMQKAKEQRQQNEYNNQFNQYSEELLNKQEQIQKMFDELFDEEFKEKYDEYNKLLEKMNKDQALDKLDEMKLDNEQLEKELDRTLELFKQLEFEKKVEESINKADELAEKQKELREKTEEKNADTESLKKEQDKLQEEMDDLEKSIEKMKELNNELEEKNELPDLEQDKEDAKDGMEKSSDELQNKKPKKASEQQKKSEESLEKMSNKLSSFQSKQSEDQAEENLEDMRQLLENLIDLSHHQEQILKEVKVTKSRDPKYVALAKSQKDILDDTKVVEDSLLALSKRVPEISKQINDEVSLVKQHMSRALDNMTNQRPNQEKRYTDMASVNQQFSMTSLNNLAIMFDAIIQQMQQQQNSKMKGDGQCKKPGNGKGGKPSASDMKKMQQGLNEQIEKLKKAMEQGKSPNGKKPGDKPGQLPGMGGSMSQELARMAAQQEAIREQLRQLSNEIQSEGGKPGSSMKQLEKLMEQTEEDLLYQNITQETLERQQQILTKLLESEKAERERELDKKRESKSAGEQPPIPSEIWEKYQKEKESEMEFYQTLPPNLKPYYRNRVNRYFSRFEE